jgi:alpha-acetolactate decarboxylase
VNKVFRKIVEMMDNENLVISNKMSETVDKIKDSKKKKKHIGLGLQSAS